MGPERNTNVYVLFQGQDAKKDLRARFGDLIEEFKAEKVNGSITLHFSSGFLAKIQSTKFD